MIQLHFHFLLLRILPSLFPMGNRRGVQVLLQVVHHHVVRHPLPQVARQVHHHVVRHPLPQVVVLIQAVFVIQTLLVIQAVLIQNKQTPFTQIQSNVV